MRRTRNIFLGTLALYAALMAVVWQICTRQAKRNTENLLDYAVRDFRDAANGAIDTMLTHTATTVVRLFGQPHECSIEEMQSLANLADVDEVNVAAKTGQIIASNLTSELGYFMANHPDAREFLVLTNGTTRVFSAPFRASATTPDVFYKYTGVAFPGGNGYVQIGLSDVHLTQMYPIILSHMYDDWHIGNKGFFLFADMRNGRLVAEPLCHIGEAKTLVEAGYDPENIPNDSRTTFMQRLYGEDCYCRVYDFASHRTIAAVPSSEYYLWRDIIFSVLGVLLFFIMGGFAFFIARVADDSERLKKFYAAEDERRAKDMEIAKTIQESALPAVFPDSPHYALQAYMAPARVVGGDFYDFFQMGPTIFAFLIADVSGKGITAALYMMTAKTLLKDMLFATRDPALAVSRTNDELCANNPANMFLTAWVGVYDLETGIVTYVNAGHNAPAILRGGTQQIEPKLLTKKSGPVMAFLAGIKYRSHQVKLEPGDALFLYTDGVTEAVDKKGVLFGDDRLEATLRTVPSLAPDAVCLHVKTAVSVFAQGAAQADDITVLTFLCKAYVQRKVRTFAVSQESLAAAMRFLDETLAEINCHDADRSAFDIILDEIVSNIIKFSNASGFELDIEILEDPKGVNLFFVDDGVPYNPLAHIDPDTKLSAAERPIGGLGIYMVKRLSDSVTYRREHNRNFLTVFKKI